MGRRKKIRSRALDTALKRLAGLETINPELMFSAGLSGIELKNQIEHFRKILFEYNSMLCEIDLKYNNLLAFEGELRDYSKRILAAIGSASVF